MPWLALLAVSASFVFVLLLTSGSPTPPATLGTPADLVDGLGGVLSSFARAIALIAVAALLAASRLPMLHVIGRRSLEIFLAHVVAFNVVRVAVGYLGMTSPPYTLCSARWLE